MTGSLVLVPAGRPLHPSVRHRFLLDDRRALWFADPRKLGRLWLVEDPAPLLAPLGPEPFSPQFTLQALAEATQKLALLLPGTAPPGGAPEEVVLLRVPRREGDPCRRCGTPVRRAVVRGRGTFFCPHCQGGAPHPPLR